MIAPAFLIKILGCATVGAFLTIGVPVMAVKEHAKKVEAKVQQRQADIDEPATLSKLFASLGSVLTGATNPVLNPGEKFSDKAFTTWKPTPADINNIAKNWSGTIEKMPNAFFIKLQDKSLTQGAGVCHIYTYRTKFNDKKINLYIPFLKTSIPSIANLGITDLGITDLGITDLGITNKVGNIITLTGRNSQSKQQLTAASTSQSTSQSTSTKEEATDLLFLYKLYDETIDRLKALGNNIEESSSGFIWDVRCP